MRALRFERFGDPSVLQLADVPRPVPGPGEALVEIRAAAINPSDVKNVAGGMSQTRPPRTPGRDFAGVVVEGPDGWRGAEVWGTGGDLGFSRDGTHAEAVLVPVEALRRKPAVLSFAEAAAVGTPFVTAAAGLVRAGLEARDVVLVVGAAGSVGSAAVQLAAWRGAEVTGVVRSAEQVAAVRALGARHAVLSGEGDAAAAVLAALGTARVTLAFDTTGGGGALDACVRVLAPGGRVVVISAPPDGRVSFGLRDFYRRNAQLHGIDSLKQSATDAAAILDELAPGFLQGALRPPAPIKEHPLARGAAAYAEARAGKLVLVP